jgi:hypothetical protein
MPERKLRQVKKQIPKVTFNHAIIYVRDVGRALHFYQDLLGLRTIDVFQYDSRPVMQGYNRLPEPLPSPYIKWNPGRICRRLIVSVSILR